jgi:hypothetical protein
MSTNSGRQPLILGIDKFGARIREHYDKVIALVVLLILVSSLVYLGVKVGLIRQMQGNFDGWLRSRRPANPIAATVEPNLYASGTSALAEPFKLDYSSWINVAMFVPETRFNCRECRLPVPMHAKMCPHCKTLPPPPKAPDPDVDGDGMLTVWENKYGLDPFDASDAAQDNDGDGYANLAEFKGGFDPTDPDSHPAAIDKIELEEIKGKKFGLHFKSRVKTRSGYKFGLNYRLPTGETKTDFVKIGDVVAGFTVTKYDEKFVEVEVPFKRKVDVSELTLTASDGETIVLTKGKAKLHIELTAHLKLLLPPDDSVRKLALRKDETFELDGSSYKVIAIDSNKVRVIILDEQTKLEIVITRNDPTGSATL